jgi:uracil-DNA glycosylase
MVRGKPPLRSETAHSPKSGPGSSAGLFVASAGRPCKGRPVVAAAYLQLLDAVIAHVETLREQGGRFVAVAPETLAALARKAPRPKQPQVPATLGTAELATVPIDGSEPSLVRTFKPSAAAVSRWSKATVPVPAKSTIALPPLPPPLSREDKEAAIRKLRPKILACTKCPNLAASRKSVVFGVGDIHAPILFVGEAPGADEDTQGEPFVGKAGELLTKMIVAMGLSRDRVFIANVLKCRPDTPGQTSGNRKPTPAEMATCLPWLQQQIDIIQPRAMVALGATAVEGLLGPNMPGITRLRGNWQDYRGIPLMPTYHPAYLLRNQTITIKREVWEDLLAVMEKLSMPITAKQRGYFLTKT